MSRRAPAADPGPPPSQAVLELVRALARLAAAEDGARREPSPADKAA